MANLEFSERLGRQIRINEPWAQLGRSTVQELGDLIERGEGKRAQKLLQAFRYEQQLIQDIYVDWIWAMLTWVQRRLGEDAVEQIMRETLGAWADARYGNYLELSFEEQVALTVEGMRGHLSGPGRLGNVEVVDEGERVVISFDPCGSGGRARRGDPGQGIPPASGRPEFGHSEEAHDWTWKRKGVCLYCAHCSLINEILPIERIGFPMRVTENPENPNDKCRWIMYRDPKQIPQEAYERVGKKKPTPQELEAIWHGVRAQAQKPEASPQHQGKPSASIDARETDETAS